VAGKEEPGGRTTSASRPKEGEFYALLGSSECGETTLAEMFGGLERSDSATISLSRTDVTSFVSVNQRGIGMVFQSKSEVGCKWIFSAEHTQYSAELGSDVTIRARVSSRRGLDRGDAIDVEIPPEMRRLLTVAGTGLSGYRGVTTVHRHISGHP